MSTTCANGHTHDTAQCPTCASNAIPKIGAPATRALANAGVHVLDDLTDWSEKDLLALHGMGPKAVGILRDHLGQRGLAFKQPKLG